MAQHGLNTLAEQRHQLSCVEGLQYEARESAACVQSIEHHAAGHSADLCSGRGDMIPLEESITVDQRQLVDAKFVLVTVEGECNEYCRGLSVWQPRSSFGSGASRSL